jgi:hypothetical protein
MQLRMVLYACFDKEERPPEGLVMTAQKAFTGREIDMYQRAFPELLGATAAKLFRDLELEKEEHKP